MAGAPLLAVPAGRRCPTNIANISQKKSAESESPKKSTASSPKQTHWVHLEAMAEILKANNVQVRSADIGDISKRDVIEASVVKQRQPLVGAILAFGVKTLPDAEIEAEANGVKIFKDPIIYNLIDNYLEWVKD